MNTTFLTRRCSFFALLAVLATPLADWSQESKRQPRQAAAESPNAKVGRTTVAVMPICLADRKEARNKFTISVATKLADKLAKNASFAVLPQKAMAESLGKAGIPYDDISKPELTDVDKALPKHDIVIFVGPHPGEKGWFRFAVARSPSLMADVIASMMAEKDVKDPGDLVDAVDVKRITEMIDALLGSKKD